RASLEPALPARRPRRRQQAEPLVEANSRVREPAPPRDLSHRQHVRTLHAPLPTACSSSPRLRLHLWHDRWSSRSPPGAFKAPSDRSRALAPGSAFGSLAGLPVHLWAPLLAPPSLAANTAPRSARRQRASRLGLAGSPARSCLR